MRSSWSSNGRLWKPRSGSGAEKNKRQARLQEEEAARKKAKGEGDMILEESILEMQQARVKAKKRVSQKNLSKASAIH